MHPLRFPRIPVPARFFALCTMGLSACASGGNGAPDVDVLSVGAGDASAGYVSYNAGDLWFTYEGEVFSVSPPDGYRVWEELPVSLGRPGPVVQRIGGDESVVVSLTAVEDPEALGAVLRSIDADTLGGLLDTDSGPIRRIDDVTVTEDGTFVTGTALDGSPILQAFRLEAGFLVVARAMSGPVLGHASAAQVRAAVEAALGSVRLLL